MPEISQIQMPSGTIYTLKDSQARSAKGWLGVTTTPLTDGASTNPITINGESVTATAGGIASYDNKEFIFNGTVWQEFGDLSDLGDLAYKDSASGNFTPSGTVSGTNVTLTTTTINGLDSVGTLPSATMPTFTVSNETLVITNGTFDAGTLPTKTSNITVATGVDTITQPTFNGTQGTVTVS